MKITRVASGKGFSYYVGPDRITDPTEIERIQAMVIPPAWTDVEIARSPNAKVLARGRDAAGRVQAIYNPRFRAAQERKKYSRILHFAAELPKLRRQVDKDLKRRKLSKDKVLACIVRLIDEAYFRVGNNRYAEQNHSYGITTMRSKHIDVSNYSVTFDFIGKSGKRHVKTIKDRTLARIIKQLDEQPGYEVFRYKDDAGRMHDISPADVNDYIKRSMGDEFTAKDFRTWGGTVLAVTILAAEEIGDSERVRKSAVTKCVKQVASRLGNTPAVARSSYIDPRVFERYMRGQGFADMQQTLANMRPRKYVQPEELFVQTVLTKTT